MVLQRKISLLLTGFVQGLVVSYLKLMFQLEKSLNSHALEYGKNISKLSILHNKELPQQHIILVAFLTIEGIPFSYDYFQLKFLLLQKALKLKQKV